MPDSDPDPGIHAFVAAFDALPDGSFEGQFNGRRYAVSKTAFSGGAAQKLVAEELGGTDYISLNLYRLARGPLLKPCEMPEAKVVAFVLGLEVSEAGQGGTGR